MPSSCARRNWRESGNIFAACASGRRSRPSRRALRAPGPRGHRAPRRPGAGGPRRALGGGLRPAAYAPRGSDRGLRRRDPPAAGGLARRPRAARGRVRGLLPRVGRHAGDVQARRRRRRARRLVAGSRRPRRRTRAGASDRKRPNAIGRTSPSAASMRAGPRCVRARTSSESAERACSTRRVARRPCSSPRPRRCRSGARCGSTTPCSSGACWPSTWTATTPIARTRPTSSATRSISHGFGSGLRVIGRAADDWAAADHGGADPALASVIGHPSLERFVEWMGTRRCSGPSARTATPGAPASTGRTSPRSRSRRHGLGWSRAGDRLVPSLQSACQTGKLDWFLLRTLWENGAPRAGLLPPHRLPRHLAAVREDSRVRPPELRRPPGWRGAALRSRPRADRPREGLLRRAEALRGDAAAGGTWGDAWRRYYEEESKAPTWSKAGGDIGRKRSYFWSVLGDWTLTLRPAVR